MSFPWNVLLWHHGPCCNIFSPSGQFISVGLEHSLKGKTLLSPSLLNHINGGNAIEERILPILSCWFSLLRKVSLGDFIITSSLSLIFGCASTMPYAESSCWSKSKRWCKYLKVKVVIYFIVKKWFWLPFMTPVAAVRQVPQRCSLRIVCTWLYTSHHWNL